MKTKRFTGPANDARRQTHAVRRGLLCVTLLCAGAAGTVSAAAPLTLQGAVSEALEANPQLQARRFEQDLSALERDIARGQRYPAVDLGASYTRYSEDSLVHPIDTPGTFPPFDRDIVNAGLSLRLPLYAGGRLVAGETLAAHDERGVLEQLRGSEQDLVFNVVSSYAKVLQLGDLHDAQARRIRGLQSEVKQIERKVEEGRAARIDALRVQAQLSQARFDQTATAQGGRDARALLGALMDRPAVQGPLALLPALALELPATAEQAAARAGDSHPGVLQAQAQLDSAADRVTIARADRRPQLDLRANGQTRRGGGWDGREDWDVGVALSMPLFDAGVRKSRVDQANMRRLQARQQLQGTVNDVTTEAYAAFGGLHTAEAQVASARQGLAEADEALRIEQLRYRAGRSTITDLLSAESARWAAVASLNQAEYDAFVAKVRLLRALGELAPGVFEGAVPAPAASRPEPAGVSTVG